MLLECLALLQAAAVFGALAAMAPGGSGRVPPLRLTEEGRVEDAAAPKPPPPRAQLRPRPGSLAPPPLFAAALPRGETYASASGPPGPPPPAPAAAPAPGPAAASAAGVQASVELEVARIVAKMKKASPAQKQPLAEPLPPGKLERPAKRSKDLDQQVRCLCSVCGSKHQRVPCISCRLLRSQEMRGAVSLLH